VLRPHFAHRARSRYGCSGERAGELEQESNVVGMLAAPAMAATVSFSRVLTGQWGACLPSQPEAFHCRTAPVALCVGVAEGRGARTGRTAMPLWSPSADPSGLNATLNTESCGQSGRADGRAESVSHRRSLLSWLPETTVRDSMWRTGIV
jgi:hypothetical protein